MVKEEGLKEAISNYLIDKFEDNKSFKCLIHEEAQVTYSYERPDLVFIYSPKGADDLDATIGIIEIENKQRNIENEPNHGVNQLTRYPGHIKYLAIPHTIYRLGKQYAENACKKRGCGLLVVNKDKETVEEVVSPSFIDDGDIRDYSIALDRWKSLKKSKKQFRRISRRRIVFEK